MRIIGEPKEPQPPAKPITCPRCGSKEIAFVSEHYKAIWARTIKFACLVILTCLIIFRINEIFLFQSENEKIQSITEQTKFFIIALATLAIFFQLLQQIEEEKEKIKCICKDCGRHWIHK